VSICYAASVVCITPLADLVPTASLPPRQRRPPIPWDQLAVSGRSLRLEAPSGPSRASYVASVRSAASRAAQRRGWSLSVQLTHDAIYITRL
jgi:hypothetical protein